MNINFKIKIKNDGEVVEESMQFSEWIEINSQGDFEYAIDLVLKCMSLINEETDVVIFSDVHSGVWQVEKIRDAQNIIGNELASFKTQLRTFIDMCEENFGGENVGIYMPILKGVLNAVQFDLDTN